MSTPQDEYYTEMLKNLIKVNNCNKITYGDSYQSPTKKKYVSTINDYLYYE